MKRISRGLRLLTQLVLHQPLPHGLMSWRYLLPDCDPLVNAHRQIWWQSLPGVPRPLWLVIQLVLWLRWQLYGGWYSCWRVLGYRRLQLLDDEGLSWWSQCRVILPQVFGWCIPAPEIYRLRCHVHPDGFLDHVYSHETTAFHRWRSDGCTRRTLELLQDKAQLSRLLNDRGLPTVPILAQIPRLSQDELIHYLPKALAVFCKPCSGHGGLGAFAAWWEAGDLVGQAHSGERLNRQAVERAWRMLLQRDDVLIQPKLTSHPAFRRLAGDSDVVTLRVISMWQQGEPDCYCAILELPLDSADLQTRYSIFPVSKSGQMQPFPSQYLSSRARQIQEGLLSYPQGLVIPDWERIYDASIAAQRIFPDYWGIAWDWALTADGPMLLEGNAGWSVLTPQILRGALLRKLFSPVPS